LTQSRSQTTSYHRLGEKLRTLAVLVPVAIVAVVGLLAIFSVSLAFTSSELPKPLTWFGNQGIFGQVIGVLTFCGVLFTGWTLKLRVDHDDRSYSLAQFKEGASLAGQSKETSKTAGLYLLREIGRDVRALHGPTILTIRSLLCTETETQWAAVKANTLLPQPDFNCNASSTLAALALQELGELRGPYARRWTKWLNEEGRCYILGYYLGPAEVRRANLSNVEFTEAAVDGVLFENIRFSGAKLKLFVGPKGVDFRRCTLNGCTIEALSFEGQKLSGSDLAERVRFKHSRSTRNGYVNGARIGDAALTHTSPAPPSAAQPSVAPPSAAPPEIS
jgi:hypothetical protein